MPYNEITLYYKQKGLSSCSASHAVTTSLIRREVTVPESTGSNITTSSPSSTATPTRHSTGMNEPTTTNRGWSVTRSCWRRRWVQSQANHYFLACFRIYYGPNMSFCFISRLCDNYGQFGKCQCMCPIIWRPSINIPASSHWRIRQILVLAELVPKQLQWAYLGFFHLNTKGKERDRG